MRVAIVAVGSRGDVQPYVALGLGLQAAGHQVTIVTHGTFARWIADHHLPIKIVAGEVDIFLANHTRKWGGVRRPGEMYASWRDYVRTLKPVIYQGALDILEACRGTDAMIINRVALLSQALAVGDTLSLPVIRAFHAPWTPTREFPAGGLRVRPVFNRASHIVLQQLIWLMIRPMASTTLQALGLPSRVPLRAHFDELDRRRQLLLYGFSPAVIPRPSDWGKWIDVTGYWFLDEERDWQPPSDLVRFLKAGPPPVLVGFGSNQERDAGAMTTMVLDALGRAGHRAVLVRGWGAIETPTISERVLTIDSAPFDWLFPRVAAVVHHGGAGTTAAGLRAGVPTVVIPAVADQPLWAKRVEGLGVGTSIPRPKLTAERLADAIRVVTDDGDMRQRATVLGERIRAEDGVGHARATLERFVDHRCA